MSIGLSTYAFFWQWQPTLPNPLSLDDMLEATAALGVTVFQICDYSAIESFDDEQLADVRERADALGIELELGTRGVHPAHLQRYLTLAAKLNVHLVRSMLYSATSRPTPAEAVEQLREVAVEYEAAGVALALETYEQVSSTVLVEIVAAVGNPVVGICSDPANCVAALELPADVIARVAPFVNNMHIKDFAFTRQEGWVGFSLVGAPMGEGLLDYDAMVAAIEPDARGINQIIEHWLPWQGDAATTRDLEAAWTAHNVHYLRSRNS
ncbi:MULTISPECIES: sugar phosphate isomerase/epimerase family protein [Subtercola]|uniref:Sugar phosphate isomerase/epimerase n=1 Tax=Subtercola vilae TaxID=2056433 RepID=A0A4T2B7J3_9MICO|nr:MULTISPECIES: sugar phosphate isomerase/epimerase family protein [Subtercola]MEA9984162.1 sugar phosphate isomerase/epimerase family protein [Subtercola sp. RTI3]TIH26905.1 sugar phosphate isomerase/epimerase [Subtercola vilae]